MEDRELSGCREPKQCRGNCLSTQRRAVEVSVRGLGQSQASRSFCGAVEGVQHFESTGGGDAEHLAGGEPVEIAILPQNEAEWSRAVAARTAKTVEYLNRSALAQFEDNSDIARTSSVCAVKKAVVAFNQARRENSVSKAPILVCGKGEQSSQLTGWGNLEHSATGLVPDATGKRCAIEVSIRRLQQKVGSLAIGADIGFGIASKTEKLLNRLGVNWG